MYERFSQQSVQSGSADEKVSQQDKEVTAATVESIGEAAPTGRMQQIRDRLSKIATRIDEHFTYGYDLYYPHISKEEALVMPEDELVESTKKILGREFAPRPKSYVNWRVIEGPVSLHVVDQRRPKPRTKQHWWQIL